MFIKRLLTILLVFNLIFGGIAYSEQPVGSAPAPAKMPGAATTGGAAPQLTPQQAEMLQKGTPEQQKAVQEVLSEKGAITPEAIEALKAKPEFQGLTPEDILKGREVLEKKEAEGKEIKKTEPPAVIEKRVIGREPEKESLFTRYRQIGEYQEISTDLRPFGYEFFEQAAIKVITERKDIPAPAEYVIGPGDEVKILLWGRVNAQYSPVVDRDGNINIPQIGPLPVAGMTFEQMSGYLIKQSEQIIGANISVTMGALKTIPIFVLGDVKRPGAYTVGSFATITDALLLVGGPSSIGTMRKVELRRKDKVIAILDLYDLLLNGDKSKDRMLQAGDIVFVSVAGPLVGIAGHVKRPAIYELRDKKDLEFLIHLAGEVIPTAYTQQIQVERIIKGERHVVVDINDKDLTRAKDFMLRDGDLIKVFPIVEKGANAIYVYGNVRHPGKYEYKPGMRIKDVIKDTNELLPETYFEYTLIKRLAPPDLRTELIPFRLDRLLLDNDEGSNIELKGQDNIYIFSKWFFKDKPSVVVEGEVRKSGRFELSKNSKARDAILLAGDLKKDAYLEKGEIIRVDDRRRYSTIYFHVGRALAGDPEENLILQDEDRIIVHSIYEKVYKKTVSAHGEVSKPGNYQLTQNMTVRDLVFTAGNVLESAYLDEAEISSQIIEDGKTVKIEHKKLNLRKALAGDPDHNLILKPYDALLVKRLQDWRKERFVTISGEVRFPGEYLTKKDEKLSALIERAGGYTDWAYLRGAEFTRVRVKELQQKSMEEMVNRLERELLAESSMQVSTALSPEEVEAKKAELASKGKFIESLRKLQAKGRMAIRLAHLRLLKGSEYDLQLENGDNLYIPSINNVVNVVGAVMAPSSFVYSDKQDYKGYVEMAGGYSRYVDEDKVYVLKVDGTAKKLSQSFISWDPFKSRWEVTAMGEAVRPIEAGDTIVVPEKLERIAWLREIKDITQILMQMAVTAGVVIHLF